MLIKTNNKEPAFRAIINVWLKDKTIYCNECGKNFDHYANECDECGCWHIGSNMDHCKAIVKQNKELMKVRLNDYASNKDKNIRWGISLPTQLFYMLDNYKKSLNRPGLFREKGEQEWFMRKFPQFRICNKV